jgi:hypothetical protein
MASTAFSTIDTLDLLGLEVGLDFALDELKDAAEGDPEAVLVASAVAETVDRVQMRVVSGPDQIAANVRDLARAREALKKLGVRGEAAMRQLEAYLRKWLER